MTGPDDFYDLLEVSDDPTEEELKQAYRTKAREYHPDSNNDERSTYQFQVLKKAYEVLGDPSEREAYDRLGHHQYVAKRLGSLPGIKPPELERTGSQEEPHAASSIHEHHDPSRTPPNDGSRDSNVHANGGVWPGESSGRRGIARRDELDSMRSAGVAAHLISISALTCYGIGVWRFIQASRIRATSLGGTVTVEDPAGVKQVLTNAGVGTEHLLNFALEATSTRTIDIAFPIGSVFLPVALGIFAWRSGRTATWVLALASMGPLSALLLEYAVRAGLADIPASLFDVIWIVLLVFVLPACVTFGWGVTAYRDLT